MKILTIMGSPKKNGKTAAALTIFEENVKSEGHEVKRINITDYRIINCAGCNGCMSKTDEPGCVQKDDLLSIFEDFFSSDVIVYATPLYSYSYSSQLKPFMDRHYCLVNTRLLEGKRTALLVTSAGKVEDNADLLVRPFEKAFRDLLHTNVIGEYFIPFSDSPDFLERAQSTAAAFANNVC